MSTCFFLSDFIQKFAPDYPFKRLNKKALVHGHCHHKAVLKFENEKKVLQRLGLDFHVLDSGCCGMAGSFGFEKDHFDVSIKSAERLLLPAIRSADADTLIITNGFSCKEQIKQLTGKEALHLAEVIQMAL